MKPGPVVAMVALLVTAFWLVLQPTLERSKRIDPEAHRFEVKLGAREVAIEQRAAPEGGFEYHTHGWQSMDVQGWIGGQRFEEILAGELAAWEARPGWERTTMGFFNISSWFNFTWVLLGLAGQACFFGRMFVQWLKSEKEQASVVPTAFWWLSFIGGLLLFAYFVWRVDIVGVLGQSTGVVIYARNLRLISKQRRRLEALRTEVAADTQPPSPTEDPACIGGPCRGDSENEDHP